MTAADRQEDTEDWAPGRLDELIDRRREVRRWWSDAEGQEKRPADMVALALSGGGIRSATFSLGLLQALAKVPRDAFSKIDIVSSVSGGGYIGCFLRSLFMPDEARGIVPKISCDAKEDSEIAPNRAVLQDQYAFARRILRSGPDERDIEWPPKQGVKRRNPLWWLREHSRYLAPNGPTDYGYALAYLSRNWLAMLYIFLVASLAVFSAIILIEAGLTRRLIPDWSWITLPAGDPRPVPCGACATGPVRIVPVSPLALLAPLPVLISAVLSIAYWMTQAMSSNEPSARRQWSNLGRAAAGAVIGIAVIAALTAWLMRGTLSEPGGPLGGQFEWLLSLGLGVMLLGVATALLVSLRIVSKGPSLTGELRRRLTKSLAASNRFFLIVTILALIDSLGAGLDYWLRNGTGQMLGTASAALLPALAFLIKKLPDWFGGSGKSGMAALFMRLAAPVAFVAGILLYGMLAVAAAALVHHFAWPGAAWAGPPDWSRMILVVGIVWVLAILSGTATGFINLSSLHLLYASRLTRAYLGATNNARLQSAVASPGAGSRITDNHPADYIQPWLYSRIDLPAPIHIINATINETIDPNSQLVARDRKGDIISVEPGGVRIGPNPPVKWSKLAERGCAEQISLGQWCAISGAAASSGMGRLTNLGFALALTFANVRLGYWWWSPGISSASGEPAPPLPLPTRLFVCVFGTFAYLSNEMTARYSLGYSRKYLTDGGHIENSGAYALIRRRVPLIVVTDNGADPHYRFGDLENLVRMTRLDLGGDLSILGGSDLLSFLKGLSTVDSQIFVDPAHEGDWRDGFTSPRKKAFVLVLRATIGNDRLHIFWLKPKVLEGLPPDVEGYASANPEFPHQSTGDQFFDEAQWESYRKLGEFAMTRLLESCPGLLA